METFRIGVGRSWYLRALGRNPLIRGSDRIEAWALVLALIIAVVAIPFVGAAGNAMYDSGIRAYTEQARTRHVVTATAIEAGASSGEPGLSLYFARGRWNAAGSDHVNVISWDHRVKAGDRQSIWVDHHGYRVGPPVSPSRAAAGAASAAVGIWLGVVGAAGGLVLAVRRRLDSSRMGAWEREVTAAVGNGGGRMDQQP